MRAAFASRRYFAQGSRHEMDRDQRERPVMMLLRRASALFAALALFTACGPKAYNEIELMPAPAIFADGQLDPFDNVQEQDFATRTQLFYATDRRPSSAEDKNAFYNNERGFVLRTGIAEVAIDPPLGSWEAARDISLQPERDQAYALSVVSTQETGIMPYSATEYMDHPPSAADLTEAGKRFASQINGQLAQSSNKDVFIYIHGYNVDFAYATLVSKELQHYLGYQGAFISYNWTATPSRFAYFRDQESALATRRNLRLLVEFLSEETEARRIHLIGYSAGTRLAFDTAYHIALGASSQAKLGKLILIGSDLDRANFIQAIEDGLLDVVRDVTLYQSHTDGALAMSRLVFGRERVGQTVDPEEAAPAAQKRLASFDNLHVIDVTDAEEGATGNGHWYFRASPWASSDLFLSLLSDKGPGARGLVRSPGQIAWRFPPDYIARLREATGVE